MKKVLVMAINDLRVFLSDRSSYVVFVMPVIMALVLGYALGGGTGPTRVIVDVINLDNSPESEQLLETLREVNSTMWLCPMDDTDEMSRCSLSGLGEEGLTLEASADRIERYETNGAIVIPEGYGEALQTFQPVSIEYHSDSSPSAGNVVLQSLQAAVQRVNSAVVAARVGDGVAETLSAESESPLFSSDEARLNFVDGVYQSAGQLWRVEAVRVRYTSSEGAEEAGAEGPTGFTQSVPGMGTMFVMFTVLSGMVMLINERQHWTLQRIVMMPVSRAQILAGKILSRFLLGIITFSLLIIVGVLTGVNFGANPVGVMLIVVVYTLCITALAFAIAPLLRNEMQVSAVTNLLGIVLAAIGGAWWPLEIVPDFMRMVARISPVSWAMSSFNELIFYGGGLADIALNLGVLLVASVVLFGIGIMNFKYE